MKGVTYSKSIVLFVNIVEVRENPFRSVHALNITSKRISSYTIGGPIYTMSMFKLFNPRFLASVNRWRAIGTVRNTYPMILPYPRNQLGHKPLLNGEYNKVLGRKSDDDVRGMIQVQNIKAHHGGERNAQGPQKRGFHEINVLVHSCYASVPAVLTFGRRGDVARKRGLGFRVNERRGCGLTHMCGR